jgi:hypothetical protein
MALCSYVPSTNTLALDFTMKYELPTYLIQSVSCHLEVVMLFSSSVQRHYFEIAPSMRRNRRTIVPRISLETAVFTTEISSLRGSWKVMRERQIICLHDVIIGIVGIGVRLGRKFRGWMGISHSYGAIGRYDTIAPYRRITAMSCQ